VEKGREWWFGVKVEIAPVWLSIGARAGFPVGGIVVQLFFDLGASI